METIRVLLVDDFWMIRDETRRILEQCPDLAVVGEAEDGQQALQLAERLQPDVMLLDIRLPKVGGIEVVKQLKQLSPGTKALILSAFDDDDYILALMDAGALGYLLKTARAAELIDAVRRVHRGEPVLHAAIAAKVARLWTRHRTVTDRELSGPLSPREREVIQLAAKGLRNKAIAEKLNISNRTVEGHFNSIFNKLGASSRLEAVLYVISHNIVNLDEEGDST
ncbi:MAG: response regulator transcription factor [Chloroflexi bacterium]|nr:response regulator transcription factor [Chloroflexota bacterium]